MEFFFESCSTLFESIKSSGLFIILFGFSVLLNLIDGHMSVWRAGIICLCSHQDLARHGMHGGDGVIDAFIT